jgi:hypothetical protein
VRGLLQLIQKQGLIPLLEDEYERANHAWTLASTRLAAVKREAKQLDTPHLSEAEVQGYLDDL